MQGDTRAPPSPSPSPTKSPQSSLRRLSLSLLHASSRTPGAQDDPTTTTTTSETLGSFKRRFSLGKAERRASHLPLEQPTARPGLPGSHLPTAARSEHHRSILQRFQLRRVSTTRSHSGFSSHSASRFSPAGKPGAHAPATGSAGRSGGVRRGQLLSEIRQRVLHPLEPDSALQRLREIALVLTFAFQVVYLPFAAAYVHPPWQAAHVLCELVWLADLALAFHTVTLNERNERVTSHREIAWRFLLRRWVVVDFAAALPLDSMTLLGNVRADVDNGSVRYASFTLLLVPRALKAEQSVKFMELLRAARGIRPARELWKWLQYSRYSHLLRIVRLVLGVLVAVHYMACIWELVRDHDHDPAGVLEGESVARRHFANLNYCILLFQGGPPDLQVGSVGQNLFAISAVLLGSLILAIVFGNVAMLVSNFYANATNYQRKMEAVVAVMRKMQLPPELRDRIHQYYEHLWREYESLDGNIESFSKQLTHTLALEVGLFKYMELILNVPFWAGCSPDFVSQIILHLEVRVYLPDDYVVRKGEMGDKLFMLNRGVCELLHLVKTRMSGPETHRGSQSGPKMYQRGSISSRYESSDGLGSDDSDDSDDDERISGREWTRSMFFGGHQTEIEIEAEEERTAYRFQPGESFGELSLLMNYRRTASVRAVGFVEMCLLNRADFQKIIARYPSDRRRVLRAIVQRCIRNNVFKDVPYPWEDIGRFLREEFPRRADPAASEQVPTAEGGRATSTKPPAASSVAIFGSDWTADEISEALVRKLDAETRDASIIFGFQPADLQPQLEVASSTSPTSRPHQELSSAWSTEDENVGSLGSAGLPPEPSTHPPTTAKSPVENEAHTESLAVADDEESADSLNLQTVEALLNDVDWLTERVQSLEATQSQLLDTLVTVGHALVSMELRVSPSQPEARELREQLEQIHNAIRMAARRMVMTDMRGRRSVAGDSLLTMDASLQSRVRLTSHLDVLKAPATSFKVEDI
ncbi:hypothetical protein ATCC90586_000999 [Pythium insidiosum]|nr:hypothetical protein ATCC90586_000999 [Pythium insidiosum]